MSDPFRDELESAHARNAQLEAENARLKGELHAARHPPAVHGTRGLPWSIVAFFGILALGLTATVSIAVAVRSAPAVAIPPQFAGVAIAPVPVTAAPPVLPALPVATSRPVAPAAPAPFCTCSTGDPLCTCASSKPPPSALDLGLSNDPRDWQKARELLEAKVFEGRGTTAEVRLLKAICKKQADDACVDVCRRLLN